MIYNKFEKGDRSPSDNYRAINLLNNTYKIYSKIVTGHIKVIAEAILLEEQSGFRMGKLCIGNVKHLNK